jgi:hypothetical protein
LDHVDIILFRPVIPNLVNLIRFFRIFFLAKYYETFAEALNLVKGVKTVISRLLIVVFSFIIVGSTLTSLAEVKKISFKENNLWPDTLFEPLMRSLIMLTEIGWDFNYFFA